MSCRAVLNLAGEHFPCDWPTDEDGRHDGWGHANKEAQAVWSSDHTVLRDKESDETGQGH